MRSNPGNCTPWSRSSNEVRPGARAGQRGRQRDARGSHPPRSAPSSSPSPTPVSLPADLSDTPMPSATCSPPPPGQLRPRRCVDADDPQAVEQPPRLRLRSRADARARHHRAVARQYDRRRGAGGCLLCPTRADSLRFCQNFQNQWVALVEVAAERLRAGRCCQLVAKNAAPRGTTRHHAAPRGTATPSKRPNLRESSRTAEGGAV